MFSNPILTKSNNILIYLSCWFIVAVIYFLLLFYGLNISVNTALVDSILFNLILCGLGLGLWYPARFLPLTDNNLVKVIGNHLIGSILTTAFWLLLGYYIINVLPFIEENYYLFFINTIPWRFLIGFLFYFLITSYYYLIIYYSSLQEKIEKESEIKNLLTEAELKSLKFQINPHFIFNSLNSMSALTIINPEKARNMILKLADFLRYTLANNETQKSLLKDELKNIRLYLDIEKIRFEDKFEFIEEMNEECTNVEVPNMILQPLIENVIKHAVYESLEKVILKMNCKRENNFLRIIMENNFDPEAASRPGTGIGLNNIRGRLKLIYNQPNLLNISKEGNIFRVTLFIPISSVEGTAK